MNQIKPETRPDSSQIDTNSKKSNLLNGFEKIRSKPIIIKSLIKETLYNSLAQAIFKIIETHYFTLKTFLLICVLASSGLCSYLIIELILSYFSYDVNTTSRTLYETPATFPKVTICNLNPFTTQYAIEFLKNINQEMYPKIDIFNEEEMSQINATYKFTLINQIFFIALNKMNTLAEIDKKKLSHPLEDLIHNCYFNVNPCSANEFAWTFDSFYGNCWTFNSGVNKTGQSVPLYSSNFPGEYFGLQVYFYVNFHENLTQFNSYSISLGGFGASGALIRIDNGSYLTSYLPKDGIKISPGSYTSISLSRSFKTNLPRPYSNCLIDNQTNGGFQSELFNIIQNSLYRCTQPTCFYQCFQKITSQECNCTNPSLVLLLPNLTQCVTPNQTNCWSSLITQQNFLTNDFFVKNCQQDCPLECYLDQFDTTLSSAELISNILFDFIISNANLKSV
jgi:hypothetical protein